MPSDHLLPLPQICVSSSSGIVANSNAVATLPAVSGKTNYITGFSCTGLGATALANVVITVAGLIGGTASYNFQFPAGVTNICTPVHVTFPVPIPASATNVAIVVTLPAAGAGNTSASCNAYGFVLA